MRMVSRICQDVQKIDSFLSLTQTGYLGLSTSNMPYIVPLNYIWYEGNVYFHGAAEGKKVDMIRENANATFVVSESYGTLTNPTPANTDTAYLSVMLFGKIEMVEDINEAAAAMQLLLDKYVPGYFNTPLSPHHVTKYHSSLGSHTAVYKFVPSEITAKENASIEENAFYIGREEKMDLKVMN